MLGLVALLVTPASAQEPAPPPASAEAPEAEVVPPTPLSPLAVDWPAGVPAPRDAAAVTVTLALVIDPTGAVVGVVPLDGPPEHAGPAAEAARGFRFAPATVAGEPVQVEVPLTLRVEPPPLAVEGTLRLEDGAPAPGVTVRLGTRVDVTDAAGRFGFRGVPPGPAPLAVDAPPGLAVAPQAVEVRPGEVVRLDLYARAPARGIVATYRVLRDEVVRRTLTAEELRTTPGTLGDPMRAITNLPGAARTPLDAGWLLVRGGNPRDTGVYIDGIRAPLIYHLGGFTSVVHPGFVDRVDFFPGGQSARYGRATAGAVDLVTRPRPETLDVRAGANIVLAGAFAAAGDAEKGLTLGVRRSYLDLVLDAVPGVSEAQAGAAPRFWDWQARGDWGPVSVLGLGYVDTLDASSAAGEQLAVTLNTQRLQGTWRGEVLGKEARVQPAFAWELRRFSLDAVDQSQDRMIWGPMLRAEWVDDGSGDRGWSAGVDATAEAYLLRYNVVDRHAVFGSPEAWGDLRIGRDHRAVLGLRVDSLLPSGERARVGASPRLSLHAPVSPALTLVGDAGVYHQAPPYDLLVGPPEGAVLRLERSWGGGVGARWERGPVHVDLDAYARRIDHLTGYDADGSLNQGDGLAYGLESMTRYQEGRLSGWLTLGWARSLRRESAGLDWTPSTYDQPVNLVLVGAWDLGRSWTIASRFRYASGFPVPTWDGADELVAYDVLRQVSVPLTGDARGRLPDFHALDLKISKRIPGRRWQLEAYLDVQNVYWRRVPEPVITGFEDLFQLYAYGFGLPTLPILGVEGRFSGARSGATPAPSPAPSPAGPSPTGGGSN